MKIKNPCIGVCTSTSLGDPVCQGCHRYRKEVYEWHRYSDLKKITVNARLSRYKKLSLGSVFSCCDFYINNIESINDTDELFEAIKKDNSSDVVEFIGTTSHQYDVVRRNMLIMMQELSMSGVKKNDF
jgi:predicted Fe-S protein YdhL (DUF1289 family)